MPEVVIADTSCFIALSRIASLDLLQKVYGRVSTTTTVANEFGQALPAWVSMEDPNDLRTVRTLALQVDPGEASAIALSMERDGSTLILDDRKGRIVATALGLKVTGTLGVLVKAKRVGALPSIKPLIAALRTAGFRTSEELEQALLREAGELEA